jgi:hypothetical protein
MTNCPYCGKEVKEGERYCHHCENDISKIADEKENPKCFIATAAYGTRFAEEINILRDFRDKKLRNSFIGNVFINFYYKTSPPIANIISKNEFLKKVVRTVLKPIIRIIKKKIKKF